MVIEQTLWATRLLLSLSMLIQSFEMLGIAKQIGLLHPWNWNHIKNDFNRWPLLFQKGLGSIYQRHFCTVIYLQIVLLMCLPWFFHWGLILIILIFHLLISIRFRGVFNGGSDYMTTVVVFGLLMTSLIKSEIQYLNFGLYYIAIQCSLSYFVAGIVKIKNRSWRSGYALQVFICHSNYNVPTFLRKMAQFPLFNRLCAWGVMLWECTFPLAWFHPKLIIVYLVIGFVFHLGNFVAFGLNRFIFAWLASYPAVLFCTLRT